MVDRTQLYDAYDRVKSACHNSWRSDTARGAIIDFAVTALQFLVEDCERVTLNSHVPSKEYISFLRNGVVARPANRQHFQTDRRSIARDWQLWSNGNLSSARLAPMLYTVSLAPCLAMELINRNDKKRPATYFECVIGHIFAKSLGIEPVRGTTLSVAGRSVQMTMDFLFEIAGDSPNIHLPVKMSTRERIVQAWAHQRLLDSAYGSDRYKGIMVLFSETKLDSRSREVVEICVPDQWLAYQSLLSRMERIYYFDLPIRYQELTNNFPSVIQIKPFHEFFTESASVVGQ